MADEKSNSGSSEGKSPSSYERLMTIKKRHGKSGSFTYDDGCIYTGNFDENGVKSGLGHLEIPPPDGNDKSASASYAGQFHKGLPNGVGVMTFSDGSSYAGEFMQGWFHGHGIYQTTAGKTFEGEFRGGRMWGKGRVTAADSDKGQISAEGYFQDSRFSQDGNAESAVAKARELASFAKKIICEAE